jgi:inhibitor of cysteine peptidase
MRFAPTIAALVAVLLVAGCGGGEPSSQLDLSAADNGGIVSADAGQRVVLTLESNASTGYRWSLAAEPDPAVLEFVSSKYVEPEDGEVVGAPGTEVWEWNAVAKGTAVLRLEYVRPFEPGNVADEFEVTVEVQ